MAPCIEFKQAVAGRWSCNSIRHCLLLPFSLGFYQPGLLLFPMFFNGMGRRMRSSPVLLAHFSTHAFSSKVRVFEPKNIPKRKPN